MRLALLYQLLLLPTCLSVTVALAQPRTDEDTLGPLRVEATRAETAPASTRLAIAIEPSLSAAREDVLLHSVVERDLWLSGEFALLPIEQMPSVTIYAEAPPDVSSWRRTGVEALLRLGATATKGGRTRFVGTVYLLRQGEQPVFSASVTQPLGSRLGAHVLADALIGALTGRAGAFASQLTFSQSRAGARRAFTIDADGHGLAVASGDHELVSASAFGPNDQLLFAASVDHGRFRLYPPSSAEASIKGSVYGISFDPPRSRVALAIAVGKGVRIFAGRDLNALGAVSTNELAMHPSYSATGRLAYVGIDGNTSRVYVDGRAVSPRGWRAASPTFCDHPGGLRLVYSAEVGRRTHLVVADETGAQRRWLTAGGADETDPACSPDGRLVAFFASGARSRRAGLYVVPLEGGQPQRISAALGDTLRWAKTLAAPRLDATAGK